ncbi:hypothetical protein [Phaeobacter sp. A36a-5a]|uniref:hypothetical protein n=1 Tax=Phaeobacter bryozoorum TaxID=1086632 RepID=UPI0035A58F3A
MTKISNKKRTKKPKLERERLKWVWPRNGTSWVPYHRVTWTDSSGKRKERNIKLNWDGDLQKLDEEYWAAEAGRHQKQTKPTKHTWAECIREWRNDAPIQKKLSAGTKKSYNREFEKILEKNADKPMSSTTKSAIRKKHNSMSAKPRAADWMLQAVSILWNYAKNKLDWPLGDNPVQGVDKYGAQRSFLAWPDWLLDALSNAPDDVRIGGELILGTGQRPAAAIKMLRSSFNGEWVTVVDEKGNETFDIYCPVRLRMVVESLDEGPRHVLSKTDVAPRSYDEIEKSFRSWRSTLTELAATHDDDAKRYSLHGLRKRACVELAEAGCSDAEIQAVTGQSLETVAKYRKEANQKAMSRTAQLRQFQE